MISPGRPRRLNRVGAATAILFGRMTQERSETSQETVLRMTNEKNENENDKWSIIESHTWTVPI